MQNTALITCGRLEKLPQHHLKKKKPTHLEQRRAGRARWDSAEGNRAQQEMKNGNAGLSRTGKQENKHNCGLPAAQSADKQRVTKGHSRHGCRDQHRLCSQTCPTSAGTTGPDWALRVTGSCCPSCSHPESPKPSCPTAPLPLPPLFQESLGLSDPGAGHTDPIPGLILPRPGPNTHQV